MNGFYANAELATADQRAWGAFGLTEFTIATLADSLVDKLYAATHEFVTYDTDEPGLTPFLGTLLKTMDMTQSIVGSLGFNDFSQSWGDFQISNLEADYDDTVRNTTAAGRTIVLKVGALDDDGRVPPYAEFVTIGTFVTENWSATRDVLRIRVREAALLDVPAQPEIYGGTGNLDGSADLAGKRKPWVFGAVSNVTPALVIAEELVYQVSWREVEAITVVYDGGFALTATSDYATSTLLRNVTTMVAGQYATCLAEGLFRLAAAPDKQVTCNAQGDNAGTGGYVTTTADVVRTIATDAGGLDWSDGFDVAAFGHVNAVQPAEVALYLQPGGELTVAEAIGNLMAGIGGWAAIDRNGKLTIDRFEAPGIAPTATYDETYMIGFDREDGVAGLSPPPKRFRVAYDRNWTPQTDVHAVVGDTDPARLAYLKEAFRVAATSEDDAAARVNDWPNATDPAVVESYFVAEADALAEAERLLELYDGVKTCYRWRVANRVFAHRVNQTVQVFYPRFGLDDGVYLRIVDVHDDPDANETDILAYGG